MKKLTALLLATVMCLGFVACGGNNGDDTTTTTETTTAPGDTTPSGDDTTTPTEPPATDEDGSTLPTTTEAPATDEDGSTLPTTTAVSTTTDKEGRTAPTNPPTNPPPTNPPSGITAPVGKGTAEVLTFYNKVANDTKNYKGKFTVTKVTKQTAELTKPLGGLLNSLVEGLNEDGNGSRTFQNGKAVDDATRTAVDYIIPEKAPYMSKLQPSDVTSATCRQLPDGRWEILIKLPDETVTAEGTPAKYAACMDVLDIKLDEIEEVAIDPATTARYNSGEVRAIINKNGLVDEVHTTEKMELNGKVKGRGSYAIIPKLTAQAFGSYSADLTFKYN